MAKTKPLSAPDLPRKRINADYFAATQPRERLWGRYQEEVIKLEKAGRVSTEDYYLLRHTLQAKTSLMELTLGEESAFTKASIPEILNNAKRKFREELGQELALERKQKVAAEERAKKFQLNDYKLRSLQKARSIKYAKNFQIFLSRLIGVLLSIGMFFSFPRLTSLESSALKYFVIISLIFLFVTMWLDVLRGTTIQNLLRGIEIRVAKRLVTAFNKFSGLDD